MTGCFKGHVMRTSGEERSFDDHVKGGDERISATAVDRRSSEEVTDSRTFSGLDGRRRGDKISFWRSCYAERNDDNVV
jgi:hypothetical protein